MAAILEEGRFMQQTLHSAPLHQYGRLRTSDASLAEGTVSKVFEPHRLTPSRRAPLNARLNAVQNGGLTLGFLAYGTKANIALPPSELWYHINIPLRGTSEARRGGATVHTRPGVSGAILLPHKDQEISWNADTSQFALKVSRRDLERHLAQLIQQPIKEPLELDLELDLSSAAGQSLLRAVNFAVAEWDDNGLLVKHPQSRRQLEQIMMDSLLMAASGKHQESFDYLSEDVSSNTLGRAVEYIRSHAQELPTLADITERCGVSVRTLQLSFRRHLDCTPLEYMQDVRLSAVRDELLNRRSEKDTVTEIATRWGFYHLGRFSANYRQRYGELPSETLRKGI